MARISCSICTIHNLLRLLNSSWIGAYMMTFQIQHKLQIKSYNILNSQNQVKFHVQIRPVFPGLVTIIYIQLAILVVLKYVEISIPLSPRHLLRLEQLTTQLQLYIQFTHHSYLEVPIFIMLCVSCCATMIKSNLWFQVATTIAMQSCTVATAKTLWYMLMYQLCTRNL